MFANVDTYQTKKGDTLLKIAANLREEFEEELTKEQLALVLYQNNPQAFQSCNIFTLKIGAKLQIPLENPFPDPKFAANEIKNHQQLWKKAKGKFEKLVCEVKKLSPKIEPSTAAVLLKENAPEAISTPLSVIPIMPAKALRPDFYSIDLIDNLQDLPSLELIPNVFFEKIPLNSNNWVWWQILITLSGFMWGFWQWFSKQKQPTENKEDFNNPSPQVLEIATLNTDNLFSEFELANVQTKELERETFQAMTPASFERLLEETLQNWYSPMQTLQYSKAEELFSEKELSTWVSNEPVIDRQALDKIFN